MISVLKKYKQVYFAKTIILSFFKTMLDLCKLYSKQVKRDYEIISI